MKLLKGYLILKHHSIVINKKYKLLKDKVLYN